MVARVIRNPLDSYLDYRRSGASGNVPGGGNSLYQEAAAQQGVPIAPGATAPQSPVGSNLPGLATPPLVPGAGYQASKEIQKRATSNTDQFNKAMVQKGQQFQTMAQQEINKNPGAAMPTVIQNVIAQDPSMFLYLQHSGIIESAEKMETLHKQLLENQGRNQALSTVGQIDIIKGSDGKPLFYRQHGIGPDGQMTFTDKNIRTEEEEPRLKAGQEAQARAEAFQNTQKGQIMKNVNEQLFGTGQPGTGQGQGKGTSGIQPGSTLGSALDRVGKYSASFEDVVSGAGGGMSGVPGLSTAIRAASLNYLGENYPGWSTTREASMKDAIHEWITGGPGTMGNIIGSGNKLVQHLELAQLAQQALSNPTDKPLMNNAANRWREAFGSQMPTDLKTIGPFLGTEFATYLSQGKGALTGTEREALEDVVTRLNGSPDQQQGAVQTAFGLMHGKMLADRQRFEQALQDHPQYGAKDYFDNNLLSEDTKRLLQQGINLPGGTVNPGGGITPGASPIDIPGKATGTGSGYPSAPPINNPADPYSLYGRD